MTPPLPLARTRRSNGGRGEPDQEPARPWQWLITVLGLAAGTILSIVGLVTLFGTRTSDQVAALAVTAVFGLLSIPVFKGLVEPQDRDFLRRLLMAAILVRLGLALIVHTQLPPSFFAPDQYTFQDVGWRTLQYLQERGPRPAQIADTLEVGYFYWNAFLFWIFGFAPVAPKLVNCFLGAWSVLLAYRIGGELVGQGGARTSGLLVAFFPSLVLWSTQNLRDTPVILGILVILLLALRYRIRAGGGRALIVIGLMIVLFFIRDYMAVMVILALTGSAILSSGRNLVTNVALSIVLVATGVVAYQQFGLGNRLLDYTSFEMLSEQRQALAGGGTAFQPDVDISTPLRGLQYLPVGIAFFLLAPFPWQLGSALSLMTFPEMMIWYALFPMIGYGGWFLVKNRFNRISPTLLFLLLTTTIYGLVEGNAGTAYRHRAQIVVFFLIFAAVGLEVWRQRRTRRRESPGPGSGMRLGGG